MIWTSLFPVILAATLLPGCRRQTAPGGLPRSLPDTLTEQGAAVLCKSMEQAVREAAAANQVVADTVFTPLPATQVTVPAQLVSYQGVHLPLPQRSYRCLLEYDSHRGFDLLLFGPSRQLIILGRMMGGEPIKDLFARQGDSPNDEEGTAFGKKLFGKVPSLYDIEDVAYSVRARDFRCSAASLVTAIRDAYALVLKTGGARIKSGVRAHRDVGLKDSHLVAGEAEGGQQLLMYSYRHGETIYSLSVDTYDREYMAQVISLLQRATAGPPPLILCSGLLTRCAPRPLRSRTHRRGSGRSVCLS